MPVALITGGEGDLAQALVQELRANSYTVHHPGKVELDVTQVASIEAYMSGLEEVDLLVCNAGVCEDSMTLNMSAESFSRVLETCLSGAFRCARATLKRMSRQRRGHIVFIGSYSAFKGPAGQANYAAAKAGLIALTQSLAAEYGSRNIRVNCIHPGFMETKMTSNLSSEIKEKFLKAHTLPSFNTPQAVAKFLAFMDAQMPHTSGQVFNLDSRVHRWT
jgi:NAD(P)-dependent dehydrogenase (short-subunit alcohol dehydrogenase family)